MSVADRRVIRASMSDGLPHLAAGWPQFEPGWVWLAGAGPGDPGLITLHAFNAIRQADIIVYDALVGKKILQWAGSNTQLEYAGKRGGKPSPEQRNISERLIELAQKKKRVLRLKGGDPFMFGRGGEEIQSLTNSGVPVKVIPGITSAIGALAAAWIPLTHRDTNQSVTFLTGHDKSGLAPAALDWSSIAKSAQVIVIYMGMQNLHMLSEHLIEGGRAPDEPVAIIVNATLDNMQILETKLVRAAEDAAKADLQPPAIICVGKVVDLRKTLMLGGS